MYKTASLWAENESQNMYYFDRNYCEIVDKSGIKWYNSAELNK